MFISSIFVTFLLVKHAVAEDVINATANIKTEVAAVETTEKPSPTEMKSGRNIRTLVDGKSYVWSPSGIGSGRSFAHSDLSRKNPSNGLQLKQLPKQTIYYHGPVGKGKTQSQRFREFAMRNSHIVKNAGGGYGGSTLYPQQSHGYQNQLISGVTPTQTHQLTGNGMQAGYSSNQLGGNQMQTGYPQSGYQTGYPSQIQTAQTGGYPQTPGNFQLQNGNYFGKPEGSDIEGGFPQQNENESQSKYPVNGQTVTGYPSNGQLQTGHPGVNQSQTGYPQRPEAGQSQTGYPSNSQLQGGYPQRPEAGQSQTGYPSGSQTQGGYPQRPGVGQSQTGYPSGSQTQGGYPQRPGVGQSQIGYPSGSQTQGGYPQRPGVGQSQTGYPSGSQTQGGYLQRPGVGQSQTGYPSGSQTQGGYPQRPGVGQSQTGYPSNSQMQGGYPQRPGSEQMKPGYPQQQGGNQIQGGYPKPGFTQQQSGNQVQGGSPQKPGYGQAQIGYPQQPGNSQTGYPQKPGISQSQVSSPQQPDGNQIQGGYPKPDAAQQGGSQVQGGYPQRPGSGLPQTGYPQQGSNQIQEGYPKPGLTQQQGGYPQKPGQIQQPSFPQQQGGSQTAYPQGSETQLQTGYPQQTGNGQTGGSYPQRPGMGQYPISGVIGSEGSNGLIESGNENEDYGNELGSGGSTSGGSNGIGGTSTTSDEKLRQYCKAPRGQFASESCNKFVNCWDDVVVEQECGGGLVFNEEKSYCDYPENVDCGGRVTSKPETGLEEDGNCPSPFATYRSDYDCGEFIICAHGIAYKFHCPNELAYNDSIGVCDYSQNVDCMGTPLLPYPEEGPESEIGEEMGENTNETDDYSNNEMSEPSEAPAPVWNYRQGKKSKASASK